MVACAAAAIKTSSGYWRAHCPFCEDDEGVAQSKRNLSIRMATGDYWCWKCGRKGFIPQISEAMFQKVAEAQRQEEEYEPLEEFDPPEGFTRLDRGEGLSGRRFKEARDYLASRGVTPGVISACKVGATRTGKYWRSIVVPILEYGVWRGFVCRRYDRKGYLYPPGMPRGEIMFNMDSLREVTDEPIAVVEGCFDALPHYPRTIALLGKPSHKHYDMLKKAQRPLAIVLDADAQREGWALAQRLQLDGVDARFVKLYPGSDPGDADAKWLQEAVFSVFSRRNFFLDIGKPVCDSSGRQSDTPHPTRRNEMKVSITLHEIETNMAQAVLSMIGGGAPTTDDVVDAEVVEDKPRKTKAKAEPEEEEAADDGEITEEMIKSTKDRKKLISIIATLADADESDVADSVKGKRVPTLVKEALKWLEDGPGEAEEEEGEEEEEAEEEEGEEEEGEEEEEEEEFFFDPDDLPKKLKKMTKLKDVVAFMVKEGVEDVDDLIAECKNLEKHVPAIAKTRAYERRVKLIVKRMK